VRELVGREAELEMIWTLVGEAAVGGAALVLSGGPGTGKTVLLDAASAAAAAAGVRVVRAVGAEFETNLSFSGLNQVLWPLLSDTGGLASVYQDALRVALGFGPGPRPDHLVISNATMALLGHAALMQPLLVIVDDAQWFDRASIAVLAFAARRGVGRVGFLWASRSGHSGPIERSGVPTHVLGPISDEDAGALLDSCFPALASRVRRRLIVEAAGNPLALVELPRALSSAELAGVEALPPTLPLTARLRALFEERITCLPRQTQRILLLAALDRAGDLGVLRAAAGTSALLDDLAPAERDRLIVLDDVNRRVDFRHPLIRSSVVQLSTGGERREAHRALANVLLDQPDRHGWHLAEASFDPDERVAAMLDEVACRMLHRGDLAGAVMTSTRAASLSPHSVDRARRLAFAAYHGARSGERQTGTRLLAVARQADPEFTGSLRDAAAAAYLHIAGDGDVCTAHQLLIDALRTHPGPWDAEHRPLIEALHTLALACSLAGKAELWTPYGQALSRPTPQAPVELLLKHTVFADPARATPASLARLERALTGLRTETDPTIILRTSGCARYVDRLHLCREPLQRIAQESTGARSMEESALGDLALDCFLTGQWDESEKLANEGLGRAKGQHHPPRTWSFRYVLALVAAVRGDDDSNRTLCDELTSWAIPQGVLSVHYGSLRARALAALGRGDFEQAYQFAVAISPPGKFASHIGEALFVCMDLVEAAVRTNRPAEANAHVAAMQEDGIAALSPKLALLVAGSAALACPGHVATELFEQALGTPDTERWPFDRARVQLAYGEHLRRTRSTSYSRVQLSAALDVFQRLGALPWVGRAGNELRAAGQARLSRDRPDAALTPQERGIATLAASGLSNKQIAERLYLSHRTVANHLHRAFPKLGIASRAGLRDALMSDELNRNVS